MSENKSVVELHGCVVCGKLFNIFVVYTPEGNLLDRSVTSSGGHIVQDEKNRLLPAIHTRKPKLSLLIRDGDLQKAMHSTMNRKITKVVPNGL